jgi:hypothetical protein
MILPGAEGILIAFYILDSGHTGQALVSAISLLIRFFNHYEKFTYVEPVIFRDVLLRGYPRFIESFFWDTPVI